MTGLRLGDVRRLRWGDIRPMGEGWVVSIVQQKKIETVNLTNGVFG